ncbi:MAG: universal stress protein [Bacteroidales bacterium]|nr:universal stress protein [Bacteroidales bacterium]
MTKILVPIDFSPNSLKSLDFVIEATKNISTEIILLWVNGIRSKDILISENEEMSTEKAATLKMEKIIEEYTPKLKNGSKIRYHIREGKVHIEVANQAKDEDVDLVVCCTHGASGFEEAYIGSNAYRMVMYCERPILTVRPNYRFQASSNIYVLPIDASRDTRQKVSFTCQLAKITKSEIHVLGLHTSKKASSLKKQVDTYANQVEKFIADEGIKSKVEFKEATNITKAIIAYAESVNADLISIMTEQESSKWSLLLGTFAQQMLSASAIPVLSIKPKNLIKTSLS